VRSSTALASEIGGGKTPEDVAEGFIRIAVENMANAIKKISVQRGYDVHRLRAQLFRHRCKRRSARLPDRRHAAA
jgi:5-oxoprolinase (ATP-hydrolysing)